MEYNEAMLTVMTYLGFVTIISLLSMGVYLFNKANKVLNKVDKFYGYIFEQEVKLRDDK